MTSYTITEPHPTVPQNTFTHVGRGGAGNFLRAPATTSPSGVPTPASSRTTPSSSTSTGRFYSGRGGAGNAHAAGERRAALSFDEEFARAEVREKTARIHVGRGGAGNFFTTSSSGSNNKSADGEELARADSAGSAASSRSSGFWERVRGLGH
ncbi:hypothetical protein N658DRAFT_504231 [Parathielavia hyrcaniae]|uniref:Uncharacterized protein n=1 Tax=Parathielavia hyrcaniae TaxID=113614 RepID=A0AAN6Q6V2_9PEZI|nr:hypothetical protein N658DRAFT_504231 [Parathielavia hyrcaniae]